MVDIGIPNNAANFYSMLSGLGDTIAESRKQNAIKSARDAALQPGISFGDALRGLVSAGDLQGAAVITQRQNHQDALDAAARSEAHQAARDKINDQHWAASYGLQKANNDRLNQTPEEKAAEREAVAKKYGIDTSTPEGRQFVLTGALPEAKKPIPFETLGGTNFLVPNTSAPGGYTTVDPKTLSPSPAAAPMATPSPPPAGPPLGAPVAQAPDAPTPTPPPAAISDLEAVDPKTGRREAWLAAQPRDVQEYIKKIANYEVDPRTSSIKGGHREQIMSAVSRYDPTYNQNEFGSRAKAIKDFSTGPQGNIIRSFDVAIDHLDTLQKAATAMQNGDMRAINAIRNAWREQTGSDLPTNFKSLVPLVSGEIAKAVIGSNNALSDREELRNNLRDAQSPEQISGVIKSYKALMGGQLKGLKKQYEETTGKKDFENRIRDVTRRELEGEKPTIAQAKEAIAAGAPREKVIERLKAAGVDPGDL